MNEDIENAINEIIACYCNLGKKRKDDPNCYRHDIFKNRDLKNLKSPQYTWQWNFSINEYNWIKDLLHKHAAVINNVIRNNNNDEDKKICCKLLQLYVSEWYKREFNGHDRQGNAFDAINVPNLANNICTTLKVNEDRVYRSNIDEIGNETGPHEWLDTIYVDGGLPLHYLLTNNNRFRNAIENVLETKAEGLDFSLVDFGNLCNNNVVNQSFRARQLFPEEDEASIYDFIDEVIIKNKLLIEGFESFNQLVRESNKNSLRNKFEARYKVFKTGRDFQLVPQLFLKSEPNGVRYSISQERLSAWGIPTNDNRIHVKITSNDKLIWGKDFYKCLRGDYLISAKNDLYDLWLDNNTLCLDKWDVFVGESKVTKLALRNPLEEHGYVQLYSANGYSWSSQAFSNYNYSTVLFDRNREISLNDDAETIITVNGEQLPWGWKQIKDQLQFTINGTLVTLYEKAGIIEVKPKKQHELSKYLTNKTNNLELFNEYEEPSFEVVLTKKGIYGEPIPETIDKDQLLLKYRRSSENYFAEWKDNLCFKSGFYQCQVSIIAKEKSKTINCFAIPQEAKICNDADNQRTVFRNFRPLTISVSKKVLDDENGVRRKYWQNQIDYHNPYATYTISDGNESFDITYSQPINAVVFKRKNRDVLFDVVSRNQEINLPILVIDRIDTFKLPENNPLFITKYDKFKRLFEDFQSHTYDRPGLKQQDIPNVKFKTFTHVFNTNNGRIEIGRGNLDFSHLRFVFVPTKEPTSFKDVILNRDDSNYYFDISEYKEEGIIVQQIGRYDIPKYYIKPIFVPKPEAINDLNQNERIRMRFRRIDNYHTLYLNGCFNEALAYFKVASQTGNYFGCFDALMGLVCHYDENHSSLVLSKHSAENLANFFKQHIETVEIVDYTSLWRMADEFLFDWMLIPRNIWEKLEVKGSVAKLLLNNPRGKKQNGYSNFINRFWEIQLPNRTTGTKNIVLRTILNVFTRGTGVNSRMQACFWNKDLSSRKSVLNELSNNNFFLNL